MVCESCEKKLSKVIVPDKWKDGARNVSDDGGRATVHRNSLLTVRGKDQRFLPSSRTCRLCKSKVAQDAYYCQLCAFHNGICAVCGKRVDDLRFDRRGLAPAAKRKAPSARGVDSGDYGTGERFEKKTKKTDDQATTSEEGPVEEEPKKGVIEEDKIEDGKQTAADHAGAALEMASAALAQNKGRTIADKAIQPQRKGETNAYSGWASATDPNSGKLYYFHALTKQTSWVWPPPLAQSNQTTTTQVEFIASTIFTGRRMGFVFTTRAPRGTGYYRDTSEKTNN